MVGVSDGVLERIERYIETHPGASAVEVLAQVGADPTKYRDTVEALLAGDDVEEDEDPDVGDQKNIRDYPPAWSSWASADFTDPNSGVWPEEWLEREQWMGHVGKKPFAPWGDRDAPAECDKDGHDTAVSCDCDARWKWGYDGHYADGETVAMAEIDPRLDGRAFIQRETDPYVYIDGDDVRDPQTGDVHPAFIAILEHLGATYTDISQSGVGVHAVYRGDFPEDLGDVKQAAWRLDENPWGSNEDLPSIEIYPGKRVCVATGEHVPGTPVEINDWNEDVLEYLLEANDQLPRSTRSGDPNDIPIDRDDHNLENYEPEATQSDEITTDIRDIFVAIDRLDAQRVAGETIVQRWNDDATTSNGERAFWPTWGSVSSDSGTANIVNDSRWQDTGELGGYGGPVTMASIDAGEVTPANARPVDGETWWRGVEHLRKLGFDIPRYEIPEEDRKRDEDFPPLLEAAFEIEDDSEISSETTSALPLKQLDTLGPEERRRAARKRGVSWPTTDDARDRLQNTLHEVMRHEDDRIVDAPTALGKSYAIASTRWATLPDVTGERPVVHLLETRDARDEAIANAQEHGGTFHVLRGRHEACPVAAGDYDPDDDEDNDRVEITIGDQPASEWLDEQCNSSGKGMPFSAAHRYLEENNDQSVDLPCCEDGECHAIKQWEEYREGPDGGFEYWPLVIATHNFAYAPGLRMANNVVIDEEPDYRIDISTDRVRKAVGAYLREIEAPVTSWEAFVQLSTHDGYQGDAAAERDAVDEALKQEPERDWYFEEPDAHLLAPALARAIFRAEIRSNDRRVGKTKHEPPRLEANARDDDDWNWEWVSVVLDDTSNDVRMVRVTPDFSAARSTIGLDAHPAEPLWQANTVPWIDTKDVLETEERQLWRRYERGLRVVQIGEATRPLSGKKSKALDWLDDEKLRTLMEQLVDEYGDSFRTAITTAQVEDRLAELMEEAGVRLERDEHGNVENLMHYGEEKSRNDFATEEIGLVNGCMDPGDGYVLDLLAEIDQDAEVETSVDGDGNEHRAKGRGFEGPDAETAEAILASVRENHVAQAAGRYARDADDPDRTATVFVRTDASPAGFVDVKVPGVEWTFTDLQREIVQELRESTGDLTAKEISEAVGCSKEHARQTLERLHEETVVQAFEGDGSHGATLYRDTGLPNSGFVDIDGSPTAPYRVTNTWSLAIRDPATADRGDHTPVIDDERGVIWDWQNADGGGTPD